MKQKKCVCKDKRYHANDILGIAPCLGSKSGYRENNPHSNPVFNSYMMAQNAYGQLEQIWNGDLDLAKEVTLGKLKILARTVKSNIYIYRESTVHNATFNGRMFPYNNYVICITKTGKIEDGSDQ